MCAARGPVQFESSGDVRRSLDYQISLNAIYERILEGGLLEQVLYDMHDDLLALMQVERLTVYERSADGREIYSKFKTGEDVGEIRMPLSPSSVAGYVALSQNSVRIADVYDPEQLLAIHSRLRFDYHYDQACGYVTRSMLVVPVCFGDTLLGVLQLINKLAGAPFTDEDEILAQRLAEVLAQKFCQDRETTKGPFEHLIQQGHISTTQLEDAEQRSVETGRSVAFILRTEEGVNDHDIGESLSQFYQLPYMGYDPDLALPEELLESLNKPFLIRNTWVPVAGDRNRVVILIDNPNDAARIMDVQSIVSADTYEFMVGVEEDILNYLGVEPEEIIADIEAPAADLDELVHRLDDERYRGGSGQGEDGQQELVSENAAAVVQLVNKLIADAVELRASDIHVEPSRQGRPGTVRMRVDGVCQEVLELPPNHVRYVVARIKIMSKIDIAESRLPQDGKISCRLHGEPLELRVATLPTVNGESIIMRILAAGEPMPFDQLNLSTRNAEVIEGMLEHPHGIILVVGPTGSGKTTTLHALLGLINSPERKILTAEDPVEITQPGLQQLQVHADIGLDFARALRSFLRCDPDVILIGEMRDYETAHAGIEASLTGHLVFTTLHTNSAPETITRLLDMGLDPLNFSDALIGVIAQRLVRTLCPRCKEAYVPNGSEVDALVNAYGPEYFLELGINEADLQLFRPVGCDHCNNTGYRGRTGIHEVLIGSEEIKHMVTQKPGAAELRELAMAEDMRTLLQDGVSKIFSGQCDLRQVRAVAIS